MTTVQDNYWTFLQKETGLLYKTETNDVQVVLPGWLAAGNWLQQSTSIMIEGAVGIDLTNIKENRVFI